jgi:hypothetical protein
MVSCEREREKEREGIKYMSRPKKNYNINELQTVREAAKNSGVPIKTLYNWLKAEIIKPVIVGSRMMLDTKTIAKLPTFYSK